MRSAEWTRRQEPNLVGARLAADRLIEHYGITSPEEIVLEDIAWDRGVVIRTGCLDGADGWLMRKGARGIIRVSERIVEPGRKRFTMGHELGHWERHACLSQAWLCTSDDIHAYRGSNAELEANAFSAALLMPATLFRRYLRKNVCLELVCDLAARFSTTLTATAVRVVEESPDDCYVVFSRGGHVHWWRGRERGSGFFIPRYHAISPESSAWFCDREPDTPSNMKAVRAEIWFPDCRDAEGYELWEESVVLRDYETVVTLLCVV